MNALGHLEKLLLAGEITEEEYKQRKAVYIVCKRHNQQRADARKAE